MACSVIRQRARIRGADLGPRRQPRSECYRDHGRLRPVLLRKLSRPHARPSPTRGHQRTGDRWLRSGWHGPACPFSTGTGDQGIPDHPDSRVNCRSGVNVRMPWPSRLRVSGLSPGLRIRLRLLGTPWQRRGRGRQTPSTRIVEAGWWRIYHHRAKATGGSCQQAGGATRCSGSYLKELLRFCRPA